MCLFNVSEPIIATEDKECFKVVKRDGEGNLLSYKEDYLFNLGKKDTSEITFDENEAAFNDHVEITSSKIIRQAFHSYPTLEDAKRDALYRADYDKNLVIVKCIIPQGSTYYKGDTCWFSWWLETVIPSYASDAIMLTEIVNFIDL
jgi:hypothetical protein